MDDIFGCALLIRYMGTVLNSPLVITILSLSLGSLVASKLASSYQRKQQIFELTVQGLKTLLDVQASWLHAHLSVLEKESHENWMRLLTTMRYLMVLFPGEDIKTKLRSYQEAGAKLCEHFGQKIDHDSMEAEDQATSKFHSALNELTKALVSRLGIKDKD